MRKKVMELDEALRNEIVSAVTISFSAFPPYLRFRSQSQWPPIRKKGRA